MVSSEMVRKFALQDNILRGYDHPRGSCHLSLVSAHFVLLRPCQPTAGWFVKIEFVHLLATAIFLKMSRAPLEPFRSLFDSSI
jgi:hypothetical protein